MTDGFSDDLRQELDPLRVVVRHPTGDRNPGLTPALVRLTLTAKEVSSSGWAPTASSSSARLTHQDSIEMGYVRPIHEPSRLVVFWRELLDATCDAVHSDRALRRSPSGGRAGAGTSIASAGRREDSATRSERERRRRPRANKGAASESGHPTRWRASSAWGARPTSCRSG